MSTGIEPSLIERAERMEQWVRPRPQDVVWLTICATLLLAQIGLMTWAPELMGGRGAYVVPLLLFAFATALAAAQVRRRLHPGRRSVLEAAAVLREWDRCGSDVPAEAAVRDRRTAAFLMSEALIRRDRWWLKVADDVRTRPLRR